MADLDDDAAKLVATECACGEEIHHPAEDDAPTCTICGEPYGECCEYFVVAGLYGHRECVLRDGDHRYQLRARIGRFCAGMSVARLERVVNLAAYLAHDECVAEGERHARERAGDRAIQQRRA